MNTAVKLNKSADFGNQGDRATAPLAVEQVVQAPEGAIVLPLEQAQPLSVTPREINAHLARILQSYDELTERFAQNKLAIDAELSNVRQSGGEVSGQILQLNAALQQQNEVLSLHASATAGEFQAVKNTFHAGMAESEARLESRFDDKVLSLSNRIDADVKRLGVGICAIDDMLASQSAIVREQTTRLNQFDIAFDLLDTATRGNRQRIETVREEAKRQHLIVKAQIEGLDALQRQHYAEFGEVRHHVGVLQAEAQRLDDAIHSVSADLVAHVGDTQRKFKLTHLSLAALLLLTLSGFALVKWAPAFAPVGIEQSVTRADERLNTLEGQVAVVPGLLETSVEQSEKMARLSGNVDALARSVTGLKNSLREMRVQIPGASTQTGLVLPSGASLFDRHWLLQQNSKAFTVQLIGVSNQDEMLAYIADHAGALDAQRLSFTVTQRDQRDRYNLFYGAFANRDQARAAIEALPADMLVNKPWVRQMGAVQNTVQ